VLQIVSASDADAPIQVRQFAATRLKHCIGEGWTPKTRREGKRVLRFSDEEKVRVRKVYVRCYLKSSPQVQSQMLVGLKFIAAADFPGNWPSLMPDVVAALGETSDLRRLAAALDVLHRVFKCFEFLPHDNPKRKTMDALVARTFGGLLSMWCKAMGANNAAGWAIQKRVAKLFYSASNVAPPAAFLSDFDGAAKPWLEAMFRSLALALPQQGVPETEEAFREWTPWKAKKWVLHSLSRLYTRYCNPRQDDPDAWKRFGGALFRSYAPRMLSAVLKMLDAHRKGATRVPDRVLQVLLGFIDSAFRKSDMYKLLGPQLPWVLRDVTYRLLCFSERDWRDWRDDPQEYLRSSNDIMQDYFDPRTTAVAILGDLMAYHGDDLLKPYMDVMVAEMRSFAKKGDSATLADAGRFYGALYSIGSCRDVLLKDVRFKGGIEGLIGQLVVPALGSKFPFVRARAIWAFSMFFDLEFQSRELFSGALRRIVALMQDKELQVQVESTLSIKLLLQNNWSLDVLLPIAPKLLKHLFDMINELDNDDLVSTLEMLIFRFGEHIHPYAVAMTQKITAEFMRLMQAAINEDDDIQALAAEELMQSQLTILASVRKRPELYPRLEPNLLPMVRRVMTQDCIDYFETGLKIMAFLTYYSPSLSPAVWAIFPELVRVSETWGTDFIAELVPVFDNYVLRGAERLVRGPGAGLLFRMIDRLLRARSEHDAREACKLAEVLLQNCRGGVDKFLPGLVQLTLARLEARTTKVQTKRLLITVLGNCFFYNAAAMTTLLESKKATAAVLRGWLDSIKLLKNVYDLKVAVVGLTSIVRLSFDRLPQSAQQAIPAIVKGALGALGAINDRLLKSTEAYKRRKQAAEARAAAAAAATSGGGASSSSGGGGSGESVPDQYGLTYGHLEQDDGIHVETVAYDGDNRFDASSASIAELEALAKETKRRLEDGDFDSDDSDSDDSDFDDLDDYYAGDVHADQDSDDDDDREDIKSPMDELDELAYFIDHFKQFSQRHTPVYQKLMSTFTAEQRNSFERMANEASKRKQQNK
jgi:importin-7